MVRKVSTEFGIVSFELERKRVKRINLRIREDGSVHVSVPYYVSYAKAEEFVKDNGRFIFSALEKMEKARAAKNTDRVYFLGEEVEVAAVIGKKVGGEVQEGRLVLTVQEDSVEERAAALDKWRREVSERLFPALCREKWEEFRRMGYDIPLPEISYRRMKSRWGSCTPGKKKITLNILLTEKDMACIEYVIVHELAHFVAADHSKRFYDVMDRVLPQHRSVRRSMR